jgi:hypothetical protein
MDLILLNSQLLDYSQAVDVGSLKGVSAPTIRILVGSQSLYFQRFYISLSDEDHLSLDPFYFSTFFVN